MRRNGNVLLTEPGHTKIVENYFGRKLGRSDLFAPHVKCSTRVRTKSTTKKRYQKFTVTNIFRATTVFYQSWKFGIAGTYDFDH